MNLVPHTDIWDENPLPVPSKLFAHVPRTRAALKVSDVRRYDGTDDPPARPVQRRSLREALLSVKGR